MLANRPTGNQGQLRDQQTNIDSNVLLPVSSPKTGGFAPPFLSLFALYKQLAFHQIFTVCGARFNKNCEFLDLYAFLVASTNKTANR
jgi:hypothetical protein